MNHYLFIISIIFELPIDLPRYHQLFPSAAHEAFHLNSNQLWIALHSHVIINLTSYLKNLNASSLPVANTVTLGLMNFVPTSTTPVFAQRYKCSHMTAVPMVIYILGHLLIHVDYFLEHWFSCSLAWTGTRCPLILNAKLMIMRNGFRITKSTNSEIGVTFVE